MYFDLSQLPLRDGYKILTGVVVPRPVALVTTVSPAGIVNAAPFSFFNLVGSDPPIVALGVASKAPGEAKDTAANLEVGAPFVVNLISADMVEAMNVCAVDFPYGISEPEMAGLELRPGNLVPVPGLAESPAALECRVHSFHLVGNNRVTLGLVVGVFLRDDLVDVEHHYVDTGGLDLIGRMGGGGGYTYTRESFELRRMDFAQWQEASAKNEFPSIILKNRSSESAS